MAENRAKNRYTNILACKNIYPELLFHLSMHNQMTIQGPSYHLLMMSLDQITLMEITFQ